MAISIEIKCLSADKQCANATSCASDSDCGMQDVLMKMKQQESTTYKQVDHIPPELVDTIEATWRRDILEWMYGVVGFCKMPRESVATASYFIDVSVAKGLVRSRVDYQICAMTALHLSLKLLDSSMMRLSSLIKLNRGLFNVKDVEEMERKMLIALNYYTHPPTSGCFLHSFLELLPRQTLPSTRSALEKITLLLAEVAVCQDQFRRYMPSTIAFAGMAVAMELFNDDEFPVWQRQHFLFKMATVAKMNSNATDFEEAIEDLQPYLTEHAKLRDLVLTIGSYNRHTKIDPSDYYVKTQAIQHSSASPRQSAIEL